ncbi:hypothetical protein SAMN06265375_101195 [Muriicola jejuensis]|uniref:hypothetical protein n=1 Tax=Muriicola jejuensis TaxID=504488 RepID=UPI001EF79BE2|nr:hypothetical protein [Muriicola jejuensis]SMP01648.1 hypothetical protein SAMN06265375_101195 [Muriicola jejuensis]
MTKFSVLFTGLTLFCTLCLQGQAKYEREFRIKKSEFPQNALLLIREEIEGVRRLRFYKEIDSSTTSFEAKFRKDRLHYSVEFSAVGELEDIELLVKEVDVPEDVYAGISAYLENDCGKFKVRRLQQQYPVTGNQNLEKVMKDAFQNLLLPYINYELVVSCRTDSGREEYEYLFDAEGIFISRRKSLPPNYDHILY